jgi:hypothetical protein
MGVIIYLTGVLCKKGNPLLGLCFFIICSTVVAPLPFYFILSPAFYWTILFPLLVGSSLNSILAGTIYKPLQSYLNRTGFYA